MKIRPIHLMIALGLNIFCLPGCKKECTNNFVNISAADQKLEQQIRSFQQKIYSNLKNGETMTVDSVRWYLEACSNYTLGDATAKSPFIANDSFILKVPVNQNHSLINDVGLAYNTINENVMLFANSIRSNDKQTLFIAVKTKSLTDDTLKLKVTSTVLYGSIVNDWSFQSGQNWKYGDWLGNCSGNFLGQDAATEIQRRIMLRRPVPVGNYYYLDLTDVQIDALNYPVPGEPPSNYGYCYMFFEDSTLPNFHTCLPYTECNLYLSGTEHVIYTADTLGGARPTTLNWNFENFSFISLDLAGGLLLNSTYYFHHGTVHYGTLHQSGFEE